MLISTRNTSPLLPASFPPLPLILSCPPPLLFLSSPSLLHPTSLYFPFSLLPCSFTPLHPPPLPPPPPPLLSFPLLPSSPLLSSHPPLLLPSSSTPTQIVVVIAYNDRYHPHHHVAMIKSKPLFAINLITDLDEFSSGSSPHSRGCHIELTTAAELTMNAYLLNWFVCYRQIDCIFASFIRSGEGVRSIRQILAEKGKRVRIISKIETHDGCRKWGIIRLSPENPEGDLIDDVPPENPEGNLIDDVPPENPEGNLIGSINDVFPKGPE